MVLNNKILAFKKNHALKTIRKYEALIKLYSDYKDFIAEDSVKKIDNKVTIKREELFRKFQEKYYDYAKEKTIFDVVYNHNYEKCKKELRLQFRAYRESTRRQIAKIQKQIAILKEKEGQEAQIDILVEKATQLSASIVEYENNKKLELEAYSVSLIEEFNSYKDKELKKAKENLGLTNATEEEIEKAIEDMKENVTFELDKFKEHYSSIINHKKDVKLAKCDKKIAKLTAKLPAKKEKFEVLVQEYTSLTGEESKQNALKKKEKLAQEIAHYEQLIETSTDDKKEKYTKIVDTLKAEFESINVETAAITSLIKDDEVLSVHDLCMYFGGIKAVNHLSFSVKEKEIFGLIGPNGAGKTTVFNCITQFYKATSGDIIFRNKNNEIVDLEKEVVHNVILQGIVRTFQNLEVIKDITVLENLLIAAHRSYTSGLFQHMIHSPILKVEESVIRARAIKVLEFMGLLKYKDMYAWGLPYGILKKIEIARTLMCNPQLIILDEPAAGLNDSETIELAALIRRIRDEYNSTILLVEHDMGLVMDVCDRICAISFGNLLALGTPVEIQQNKAVQEAYLGVSED